MPELRQDPTTKERIIIATERAKRPHDFRSVGGRAARPAYDEACPFCPGHEARTPSESLGVAAWEAEERLPGKVLKKGN